MTWASWGCRGGRAQAQVSLLVGWFAGEPWAQTLRSLILGDTRCLGWERGGGGVSSSSLSTKSSRGNVLGALGPRKTCLGRRAQVDDGPLRTLAVPLTCVWKTPCCWGGSPWAFGGAPGEHVSRHPCGGGPLGQVLSRGGIPGPGGIIILIGVALGESGAWIEPCPVSEVLAAAPNYPSRISCSDSGSPTPSPVPVQVSPTSSSWSQLCWPHAPAGQSLSEASIPLQPTSSSQMGPVPGP